MMYGRAMQATFEETNLSHPWITFNFDASKLPAKCWILLGEIKSSCQRIADVPLQPSVAKQLLNLVVSKGAHATAAIEGNTLSEDQVQKRLNNDLELPPSQEEMGKEIDNVAAVYNQIKNDLFDGKAKYLTVEEICSYNRQFLNGLTLPDEVRPGEIRKYSVGVRRYRGAPWQECKILLAALCDWLNSDRFPTDEIYIILKGILAHLYIAWIHPFGDGNGRTARAVELKILLAGGIPAVAAHLLTAHYNKTRNDYYRQLDYASESGGDVNQFIQYALQGFLDNLNEEFKVIRDQHLKITWRNYIYDFFKTRTGIANDRRRRLILDLSDHEEPIPFLQIRHVSSRVAELYARKTDMTVRRDLVFLIEAELITFVPNKGYAANSALVKSFLPEKAPMEDKV
jgi:Fic family protein